VKYAYVMTQSTIASVRAGDPYAVSDGRDQPDDLLEALGRGEGARFLVRNKEGQVLAEGRYCGEVQYRLAMLAGLEVYGADSLAFPP
jgi:hypothetical protein